MYAKCAFVGEGQAEGEFADARNDLHLHCQKGFEMMRIPNTPFIKCFACLRAVFIPSGCTDKISSASFYSILQSIRDITSTMNPFDAWSDCLRSFRNWAKRSRVTVLERADVAS